MSLNFLRNAIREETHADEHALVTQLVSQNTLANSSRERITEAAQTLVTDCRNDKHGKGTLDAFLQEFGLSNKEGVALMCLAEALLRIPDADTADRLIAEKVHSGDWGSHQGKSDSLFVNASTWGLMLTGKMLDLDPEITEKTQSWSKRLSNKLSEPVVRKAVFQAMRIMGGQYVLGKTIAEGITRSAKENDPVTRFSFDMLGESARGETQAKKYFDAYSHAIEAIGANSAAAEVIAANGISVKLSALHPRYHFSHRDTVLTELLPRIKALCVQAKQCNMGLSIDAEEAERLDISLDIFESLARDPDLQDWQGLGFVLQAYQKRAPYTASWLIELARETQRRLMVRLVKGAYWDAEIKRAQEQGFSSYPVFTRKANTDLCYQHCATILLGNQATIYPQFATHNAYTAAMILELAGSRDFEFQRLHGMGHILYKQLQQQNPKRQISLRVYAPIGKHRDLLPYLVRRLLENGANSSFVNRFLDDDTPVSELIQDNLQQVTAAFPYLHKQIPAPQDIYIGADSQRKNARGINLDCPLESQSLLEKMATADEKNWLAGPIVNGIVNQSRQSPCFSPSNIQRLVGHSSEATAAATDQALASADQAQAEWRQTDCAYRAHLLRCSADLLESNSAELISIISLEAGRTIADALSEVREAVDFCRYYADQAEVIFSADTQLRGCGPFLCISPWNFPLAIFVGQVSAALAAGNTVIAKPAEQTPLVAARAVTLLHKAGIPIAVLQLLTGDGAAIGGQLIPDPRLAGITFTGSTETAQLINRQLAQRPAPTIPFIAETGGQNCMLVDSTALPEQVIDDVIASAFLSAGQRCSALRVLFLQADIADSLLVMLKDAMASLVLGDPQKLATDVGPVIDKAALTTLQNHIQRMHNEAQFIASAPAVSDDTQGWFCTPHVFEIDSLAQLQREVFGPVLHVIRYRSDQLNEVLQQIDDSGYGLTLGIHSRIEAVAQYVFRHTQVGNTYVNRNMVGAVVGVNPFGGRGLSGTGPKAGGPHYLYRFARSNTAPAQVSEPSETVHGTATASTGSDSLHANDAIEAAHQAFLQWSAVAATQRAQILRSAADKIIAADSVLPAYFQLFAKLAENKLAQALIMAGPTGELNRLSVHPRGIFVVTTADCLSAQRCGIQLAAALSAGCAVLLHGRSDAALLNNGVLSQLLEAGMPANTVQYLSSENIQLTDLLDNTRIHGVLCDSESAGDTSAIRTQLAQRSGAITPLIELPVAVPASDEILWFGYLSHFFTEKTFTDNLIAKGGNTSLFNLAE